MRRACHLSVVDATPGGFLCLLWTPHPGWFSPFRRQEPTAWMYSLSRQLISQPVEWFEQLKWELPANKGDIFPCWALTCARRMSRISRIRLRRLSPGNSPRKSQHCSRSQAYVPSARQPQPGRPFCWGLVAIAFSTAFRFCITSVVFETFLEWEHPSKYCTRVLQKPKLC